MWLILQLATSCMTLLSVHLAGKKDMRFAAVGLANQLLWIAVILQSKTYGILVLTVAMVWTYSKTLWRWREEVFGGLRRK